MQNALLIIWCKKIEIVLCFAYTMQALYSAKHWVLLKCFLWIPFHFLSYGLQLVVPCHVHCLGQTEKRGRKDPDTQSREPRQVSPCQPPLGISHQAPGRVYFKRWAVFYLRETHLKVMRKPWQLSNGSPSWLSFLGTKNTTEPFFINLGDFSIWQISGL